MFGIVPEFHHLGHGGGYATCKRPRVVVVVVRTLVVIVGALVPIGLYQVVDVVLRFDGERLTLFQACPIGTDFVGGRGFHGHGGPDLFGVAVEPCFEVGR